MTQLSQEIFKNYQIRKTKKQKTVFIELLQSYYPEMQVEKGGFGGNRNLVIGDVDNAKIVVSAHYDTCAELPIPNFIAPKNILPNVIYQGGLVLLIFAIHMITIMISGSLLIAQIVLLLVIGCMFMGKPNVNTANDNTSGIITLVETMSKLPQEYQNDMAFVFFDNEENGLLGSSFFRKKHKKAMQNKLLINLDCVSDGDNIMLVVNKNAKKYIGDKLDTNFVVSGDKKLLIENSATTFYPSDQMGFNCTIAVCALKYKKWCGYYMDKIHTKKDVNFDEKNIEIIAKGICNCIINQ